MNTGTSPASEASDPAPFPPPDYDPCRAACQFGHDKARCLGAAAVGRCLAAYADPTFGAYVRARYRGEPTAKPAPVAYRRIPPAMRDRINTCPYRECRTGCERTKCHAGRGDRWHGETYGLVTLQDCERCQRELTPATSAG